MKRTREEKAITLIALIITIVVLLILAVVAINAVTGDRIIQHATNARSEYDKAQDEENKTLSYYEQYLEAQGDWGPWKQDGNKIYMTNSEEKTIELEIGDVVNYDATAGVSNNNLLTYISKEEVTGISDQTFTATKGTWKVLGTEHGKLLLMSANDIMTDANSYYTMIGNRVYIVAIDELANICSIYGHGKGAESARSIKAEDVNKITGYTPEKYGSGYEGFNQYGGTITYKGEEEKITYTPTHGTDGIVKKDGEVFNYLHYIENGEWKMHSLEEGETKSFKIDVYAYAASQESSKASAISINMNMSSSSKEYKMLFTNLKDSTEARYFLASRYTKIKENYMWTMYYGLRSVNSGGVGWYAAGAETTGVMSNGAAIRPVVTLKSDVELKDNDNDGILDLN